MKSGTKVALAMGAGYVLGRKHKMRLALLLGAAAASGRLPSAPGELLKRTPLGSAPGLDKAGLGGRLAQAGKAAAVTVASSQIESITDRLHSRAESLRKGGGQAEAEESEDSEEPQERRQASKKQRPEETDEYDEEPYDESESYEEDEEEPETPRGRTGRRNEEPEDTDTEDFDEEPEERSESDEEPETERRPVRAAGSRRASPIRRGGR